ncbi:MAG: hypothetical protein ACYDG6_14595 [Thermincolia bacterium]
MKIPWISFKLKTLDFRKWYYVYFNDKEVGWWVLEYELENIKKCHPEEKLVFKKIPWYKTILS